MARSLYSLDKAAAKAQADEAYQAQFERFRPDGWPYCPRCDEDELYSLAEPPTVATICGCYSLGCGFAPRRADFRDFMPPRSGGQP